MNLRDRRYNLDGSIFASLVQLAIAVLYDLGLDKPPSNDQGLLLEHELKGIPKPSRCFRSPTLEERRVLLGCYLLSSTYESYIPLDFTSALIVIGLHSHAKAKHYAGRHTTTSLL